MKKNVLSFMAFFAIMSCGLYAQNRTTAILQHGETPKVFYGNNAFVEAFALAQAGDVISLSNGTFNVPEKISIPIKVQGSGSLTLLAAVLMVDLPEDVTGLWIEGIKMPGMTMNGIINGATVQSCYFAGDLNVNSSGNGCLFNKCRTERIFLSGNLDGLVFCNCIIDERVCGDRNTECAPVFKNSVINRFVESNSYDYVRGKYLYGISSGILENCIVRDNMATGTQFSFLNVVYWLGNPSSDAIQENLIKLSNSDFNALFKKDTLYELTNEAANTYTGTDGTQIGAYGGQSPFTLVPAIPRISYGGVSSVTNAEGKLPVTINVEVRN